MLSFLSVVWYRLVVMLMRLIYRIYAGAMPTKAGSYIGMPGHHGTEFSTAQCQNTVGSNTRLVQLFLCMPEKRRKSKLPTAAPTDLDTKKLNPSKALVEKLPPVWLWQPAELDGRVDKSEAQAAPRNATMVDQGRLSAKTHAPCSQRCDR